MITRNLLSFLILSLLLCVQAQAQEGIDKHVDMLHVHYHTDGAQTKYFVTSQIDSITFSSIGVDSIRYPEWRTQEIWTNDSTFRIVREDIDSISISHTDLLEVIADLVRVSNECGTLFMSCNTTAQLGERLSEIKAVEGVEDAWTDPQTLFVKIRNWGVITFVYPLEASSSNSSVTPSARNEARAITVIDGTHECINGRRVCIVNTTHGEKGKEYTLGIEDDLVSKYLTVNDGFTVDCITSPGMSFFTQDMFRYDVVFLMTHGNWDGQNFWMKTGSSLVSNENKLDDSELIKMLQEHHPLLYRPDYLTVMGTKNLHVVENEVKEILVYNIAVSDKYISSSYDRFDSDGDAIIFNVACQSMMEGSNLAKVYIQKGARCYLGFTDVNTIGAKSGQEFFTQLLHGKSVQSIRNSFPQELKSESFIDEGKTYSPRLHIRFKEHLDFCLLKPDKPSKVVNNSNPQGMLLEFYGSMPTLEPDDAARYGFAFSKDPEMTDKTFIMADDVEMTNGRVWFKASVTSEVLEENTTYYYAAFYDDNGYYCYGESSEITTPVVLPVVETLQASDIDGEEMKATIRARISPYRRRQDVKVGFIVSTTNWQPKLGDNGVIVSSLTSTDQLESEVFTETLGNLSDKTTYYYRGFAIAVPSNPEQDETEVEYGDVMSFYIEETESYFIETDATDVMFDSATLNGELHIISGDRENTLVADAEVGFYWRNGGYDPWKWISLGIVKNLPNGKVSAHIKGLDVGATCYYALTLKIPGYDSTPESNSWCSTFQTADITTDESTSVTSFGARLNAHIIRNDCVADLSGMETGFLVGPNQTFVRSEGTKKDGSFSASLNNLFSSTLYDVTACVRINGQVISAVGWGGAVYTEHYPFRAEISVSDISSSSATLKAHILDAPSIHAGEEISVLFKYEAKSTDLPDDMTWVQNAFSYLAYVRPYRDSVLGEQEGTDTYAAHLGAATLVGCTSYEMMTTISVYCERTGEYGEKYFGETVDLEPIMFTTGEWPTAPSSSNYVDLGTSVMWSYTNVGATHPTGYGSRFAWGEAEPDKNYFDEEHYAFTDKVYNEKGVYVGDTIRYLGDVISSIADVSFTTIPELVDGILPTTDDYNLLGTPTWCKWKGIEGVLLFGPNGNCIFMPFTGYAKDDKVRGYNGDYCYSYYWTGNMYKNEHNYNSAYAARILSSQNNHDFCEFSLHPQERWTGCSLRLVKKK